MSTCRFVFTLWIDCILIINMYLNIFTFAVFISSLLNFLLITMLTFDNDFGLVAVCFADHKVSCSMPNVQNMSLRFFIEKQFISN